jgi:NAD(P)-dependent dehydrogenase (short-subunit alcohol dehydrogenase family)
MPSSTGSSAGGTSPDSRWWARPTGRSFGSMPKNAPVAIVTGASRGLGLALSHALAVRGFGLVIDARGRDGLERARGDLAAHTDVAAIAGDVTDPDHRAALVAAVGERIDLLVNNASRLGPSPQPPLHAYPLDELERVYATNVIAPLALAQLALPLMDEGATILNISSDAAVEPYEGWGGYGSSKAALDQLTRVLAVEHPQLHIHAVDPGDMRTQMHQDAFPGEDISDRPPPAESVPGLLALIGSDRGSGRFVARDLTPVGT